MNASKTWALVLMGGGARGLAHVGVVRVLERAGLVPDIVAGTSMGGLVGGLYAAGVSGTRMTGMIGGMDLGAAADEAGLRRLFEAVPGTSSNTSSSRITRTGSSPRSASTKRTRSKPT